MTINFFPRNEFHNFFSTYSKLIPPFMANMNNLRYLSLHEPFFQELFTLIELRRMLQFTIFVATNEALIKTESGFAVKLVLTDSSCTLFSSGLPSSTLSLNF